MNAAGRRCLTPVLGAIALALVLVLIALWAGLGRGVHWRAAASAAPLPPGGAVTPPPTVPPPGHFAAVWQKPLFSPTRRPGAAIGAAGDSGGDLQLTGVVMVPGLRMAILHDRASNRDYRLIEGQPARDGAPALIELQPRSAVVDAAGSRQELQLMPGPAPGSSADSASGAAATGDQRADQPSGAAPAGASAMVTRRAAQEGASAGSATAGAAQLAARARALKARIEARRREQQQNDGG